MATDVIQLNQSYGRPSLQTNWTSPSSMVMSLQTVLITLFFTRSLLSTFVLVTLMIFLKTCPHGLLFISMRDDENMGSSPILHATIWTSPSSMVMVLIALFFTWSLPSNFVLVTLMIFLKTCPPGLLFISMRDDENKSGAFSDARSCTILQQLVVLVTLMHNTVYLLGKNCASNDDDKPGAFSDSRCHTIL